MLRTPIEQKRYSLNDALTSVPAKHFKSVIGDIAHIMGLSNRMNVLGYRKGLQQPTLSQAKAVEEYFLTEWGITEVWKEIDSPLIFRKRGSKGTDTICRTVLYTEPIDQPSNSNL